MEHTYEKANCCDNHTCPKHKYKRKFVRFDGDIVKHSLRFLYAYLNGFVGINLCSCITRFSAVTVSGTAIVSFLAKASLDVRL